MERSRAPYGAWYWARTLDVNLTCPAAISNSLHTVHRGAPAMRTNDALVHTCEPFPLGRLWQRAILSTAWYGLACALPNNYV